MIKALAFLLLLDYSGSMDQTLNGKPKISILKSQVGALLEGARPESDAQAIIFGSEPKNGCHDLIKLSGQNKKISLAIQKTKSGAFGKTPLSDGLIQLTEIAIKTKTKNIISVTDGGDSCGNDPCKALLSANQKLSKANQKMNLIIIGFDLKGDKGQLSCLKDLKLSHLNITMLDAGNASDLQRELKKAQESALRLNADLDQQSMAGHGDGSISKNKSNSNSSDKGKDGNSSAKPGDIAFVEIVGAPVEAAFSLAGAKDNRQWHGDFILETKPGEYILKFEDIEGSSMDISLAASQKKQIPWGSLMKNAKASISFQNANFELKWTPDNDTKKIHGDVKEVVTEASVAVSAEEQNVQLPFGNYSLAVMNPPWLKEKVKIQTKTFTRGQNLKINFRENWNTEINWIENPHPDRLQVLEITDSQSNTERYLLPTGVQSVPVLKEMKVRFLMQ